MYAYMVYAEATRNMSPVKAREAGKPIRLERREENNTSASIGPAHIVSK